MDSRLLEKDILVFDVGNVLIRFDRRLISDGFHLSPALEDAVFGSGLWSWIDTGLISNGDLAKLMCRYAHTDKPEDFLTVARVLDDFYLHEIPLKASLWLPELKAAGKKLYYLSNYSSPAFERTMTRFPFFSLFDGGIVSAREHMVKPMPAIYLLLCERYGFSPEDALFVDDSGANTEAARRLGFSVWQYQGEDL